MNRLFIKEKDRKWYLEIFNREYHCVSQKYCRKSYSTLLQKIKGLASDYPVDVIAFIVKDRDEYQRLKLVDLEDKILEIVSCQVNFLIHPGVFDKARRI